MGWNCQQKITWNRNNNFRRKKNSARKVFIDYLNFLIWDHWRSHFLSNKIMKIVPATFSKLIEWYREGEREGVKPAHSCASVRWVTASRFVARKRQPGFSRTHSVPYLPMTNKKKLLIVNVECIAMLPLITQFQRTYWTL